MVVDPLQSRIGKNQVELLRRLEVIHIARDKVKLVLRPFFRFRKHGVRVVDTDCLLHFHSLVQLRREFTGAATDVESCADLGKIHLSRQIPKWLGSFNLKAIVLLGIPVIHNTALSLSLPGEKSCQKIQEMPQGQRRYLPFLILLFIAALVVYGQLLTAGPITWDDDSNIFKNPYYAAGIWSHFWTHSYFGLFVPVTSTIWQALYTLGGGSALPFRLLNLSLHLANGILVFGLLRSLSRRWQLPSQTAVIFATAIFVLHPMQDQAVNWISGGRDLISAFFALLCVYCFFRWPGWRGAVVATVCFTLSIFSKPNSVVLPALLPLLVYLIDRPRLKSSFLLGAIWMVPATFSIYMNIQAQADFLIPLKWWERVLVAGDTFTFYLQKLFFPYPLSANYDRQPEYILARWAPYFRTLLLGLLALTAYVCIVPRERRSLIFLAWFALLTPVSGLVAFGYQKISTTANHYHYLPMVVFAAGSVLVLNKWRSWEKVARWTLTGVIVVLAFMANARVQVWKNDGNFFADMAEYTPNSYSTALGMSVVKCAQENNYAEGLRWTEVALRERPLDILALANQAYCYLHAKDYARLVQMELYLEQLDRLEMENKQPTAYSSFLASVGTGLFEMGHPQDGFQFLCEAFRVMPAEYNHRRNMEVGRALMIKAGHVPECKQPFQPSLLKPSTEEP